MREACRVPIQRLFVIAPSVARLIRKERGGERVLEGYFPDQPQRSTYVQIEETRSSLILEAGADEASEERADIPPAHAQALLAVSQGQVEYLRTSLSIGSHEIQVLHFLRPAPLDLLAVAIPPGDEQAFHPLPWFGPEVTEDPAYQGRTVALNGVKSVPEVEITDAALNSLLDALEGRFGAHQPQAAPPQPVAPSRAAEAEAENEDDHDDLEIEDSVIRELARSLSPRKG
jgi:CYTH domain-containing protein